MTVLDLAPALLILYRPRFPRQLDGINTKPPSA